jgi:hypothetical protein
MTMIRYGPIQRRISRAFIARPDALLSTTELVRLVYPRLRADELKRSNWYSVRLAAAKVAVRVGRERPYGTIVWAGQANQGRRRRGGYLCANFTVETGHLPSWPLIEIKRP